MPAMPHGIYPSRDGRLLYVSDRAAGKVSVFSLARRRVVTPGRCRAAAAPTWAGCRRTAGPVALRALRRRGVRLEHPHRRLVARIHVGGNPHGLLVWPQPGRYSLGHTANLR